MNNKTDIDVKYVSPLKKICMTIGELPASYLETMSYYEMLVWFVEFLKNQVIPTVNNNAEAVSELQALYEELRTYVNNYFDNLDVQDEINNKLEAMAESGQLTDIIAQYLGLAGMIAFDTVADMKLATNLVNGSKCQTLGYRAVNDGGNAIYKVRTVTNDDVVDEGSIIALYNNTLVAELVFDDTVNVKQFGAYGDNTHDDTTAFENALTVLKTKEESFSSNNGDGNIYTGYDPTLIIPTGKYKVNNVDSNLIYLSIKGENAVIYAEDNAFNLTNGFKIYIEGIKFVECEKAIALTGQNQETGYVKILNCEFINCTSHAIHITYKQSYIGLIENCTFFKCYYVLDETNCDLMLMKNCWISERTRTQDYDSSIICNGGEFQMESCLVVPVNTTYKEPSYISGTGNCKFTILNSHFGAETGAKAIVRIKNANDSVIIDNCQILYTSKNNCAILLETGFDFITVRNCGGMVDWMIPIKWSELATQEIQDAFVTSNAKKKNIVIDNIGKSREEAMWYRYDFLPANLTPFLNIDGSNLKYWKQLYNYEVAQDKNSMTVTPTLGSDTLARVDYRFSKIKIELMVKDYNTSKEYQEDLILSPIVLGGGVTYGVSTIGGLDNSKFTVTTSGNYYTQGFTITITTSNTNFTIESVYNVEQLNDIIRSRFATIGS